MSWCLKIYFRKIVLFKIDWRKRDKPECDRELIELNWEKSPAQPTVLRRWVQLSDSSGPSPPPLRLRGPTSRRFVLLWRQGVCSYPKSCFYSHSVSSSSDSASVPSLIIKQRRLFFLCRYSSTSSRRSPWTPSRKRYFS